MTQSINTQNLSHSVSIQQNAGRKTPPRAADRFRASLQNAAGTAIRAVNGGAGLIPLGTQVLASSRNTISAGSTSSTLNNLTGLNLTSSGNTGGNSAAGAGKLADNVLGGAQSQLNEESDMEGMLKLQQSMYQQNLHFTTVSNVMKSKHETSKNTVSNIR